MTTMDKPLLWTFCLLLMIVDVISAQTSSAPVAAAVREHKVHNIMLYPEKHSWCKPTPIKQVVTHPGCRSMDIENNICVGACFSFSVPRTIPETPGDDQLYYCDSCQPHTVSWTIVLLQCPNTLTGEPVSKMVELISNCSCSTVKNMEMYENQLSSSFGGGEDDNNEDGGQDTEEEEEEDNSLPEINDFISRKENSKLKSILSPTVLHLVSGGAGKTGNLSRPAVATTTTSSSTSASVSDDVNVTSNLFNSKLSHLDQQLQFQDLSSELVDESEVEPEEGDEATVIDEQ